MQRTTTADTRPHWAERGAAMVEAALLLPLFFALVLGLITFGDSYFARISIEDAVRDGTRFASTIDDLDADADTTTDTAHEQLIKQRVVGLAGGELEVSEVCVALVTATGSNTACDVSDPDGAEVKPDEVVKVSAQTTGRIEVIFFTWDIDLTAGAAAAYAR